MSENRRW